MHFQLKLDGTREKMLSGNELNEDQKEAINRYNVVEGNLELIRELRGQFIQIQTDVSSPISCVHKLEKFLFDHVPFSGKVRQ